MNPFKLLNTTAKVALLPREMGDISGHIRRKLNSILLVYSPELKAVPIMFSDVSFETGKEYGKIIEEMPWIHVNVKVQLLVFSVESGNVLQGKITQVRQPLENLIGYLTPQQVSDTHVSLLVYGMFNASICSERLIDSHTFNASKSCWELKVDAVLRSGRQRTMLKTLEVGKQVDVRVIGCQHSVTGVLFIEGSLLTQ